MLLNGTEVRDASGKVIGHAYGYVGTDDRPAEAEKAVISEALPDEPKNEPTEAKKPAKTTKKAVKK